MSWLMQQSEITAAHEVGHALVGYHLQCRVKYIRSASAPEYNINPTTCVVPGHVKRDDLKQYFAGGVAGVMFWRGRRFAPEIKSDYFRRLFSKSIVCYYLSRRGSAGDRVPFNEVHFAEYGCIPSDPTFYMYASTAVDILSKKKALFLVVMDELLKHSFISQLNFMNLVSGKPFDAEENSFAKGVADGQLFGV